MASLLNFETWVAPRHMDDGWLPSMFEPGLMRRLVEVENSGKELVSLADFCSSVRWTDKKSLDPASCRWIFDGTDIRRARVSDFENQRIRLAKLPAEAVLVGRIVGTNPSIHYWNEEVFQGGACFDLHKYYALITDSVGAVAWLAKALNTDFAKVQIQRFSQGSVLPVISLEQISNVKVVRPTEAEQEIYAIQSMKTAEAQADLLRMSRHRPTVLLTGQTIEERLTQFEQFVIDDTFFGQRDFFYIEPANKNNSSSDLFVSSSRIPNKFRRLKDLDFRPSENAEVSTNWREWFWDISSQEDYRVFNSLVGGSELPGYLIAQSFLPDLGEGFILHDGLPRRIPSFSVFRETIKSHGYDTPESELANDWAEIWAEINKIDADEIKRAFDSDIGGKFVEDVFTWATHVYRPALVVKVRNEGKPVGAYVFLGEPDIRLTENSFASLDDFGFQFSEILMPSSSSVESVTKRESLRRLSWLMHQLNGPIGRAKRVFKDLEEYIKVNDEVANALVPSEDKARRRAAMQDPENPSIKEHTFASRLRAAEKAVNEIRSVSYQIRRLKRVQGDLEKTQFSLAKVLNQLAEGIRTRIPNIDISRNYERDLVAYGEEQSIREAFEEVINNSCRELHARKVDAPAIQIIASQNGDKTVIQIRDNALPPHETIAVDDPFKEDASSYAKDGKGTGLGLAIVRDTFRAHHGACTLEENISDGKRTSGVSFVATMEFKNE